MSRSVAEVLTDPDEVGRHGGALSDAANLASTRVFGRRFSAISPKVFCRARLPCTWNGKTFLLPMAERALNEGA